MEHITESLGITQRMMSLLQSYYKETLAISNLVDKDSDDEDSSLNEILALLEVREVIIKEYNGLVKELESKQVNTSENLSKEIDLFKNQRDNLIKTIESIDLQNMQKLNKLFNEHQSKINQIQQGKILHNAYDAHHPSAWGVFIDKKK